MPYKNKADAIRRKRVRRALHPERVAAEKRSWHLRSSYGITLERYDEMLAAQGGRCALCGRARDGQRLHVDHDHKTGEIRGLLCAFCNVGLSWFESGWLEMVRDAIGRYLRKA